MTTFLVSPFIDDFFASGSSGSECGSSICEFELQCQSLQQQNLREPNHRIKMLFLERANSLLGITIRIERRADPLLQIFYSVSPADAAIGIGSESGSIASQLTQKTALGNQEYTSGKTSLVMRLGALLAASPQK
jgi:hypothetical protein